MPEATQLIFFDFEMLCSERGMSFFDMEAIRLGAVKYNLITNEITFFDHYIKPHQQEPLSNFCKNLTNIKDQDIADANDFSQVLNEFVSWVGNIDNSRFYSWSSNDLSRLELDANRNGHSIKVINEIKLRYIDFQKLFSKRVTKTNPSVEHALSLYDLNFEGVLHNPMYDAYNTLRVYLAFTKELVKSDLIMLNHFVFTHDDNHLETNINEKLSFVIKNDLFNLLDNIEPITNIRNAKKLLKRTNKVVKKYENILINRSGIFDQKILLLVRLIVEFYKDLQASYNEHDLYGSKIFILHEHLTSPLRAISA